MLYLVIPAYNEEKRLNFSEMKILANHKISIIFVNDCSSDDTSKLIEEFTVVYGGKLIDLEKNVGKGEAVRAGLNYAISISENDADLIGFVDADNAINASEIIRFTNLMESKLRFAHDALWSSRVALAGRDIKRDLKRHYFGRFIATLIGMKYPKNPYDTQSGFKIFKKSEALAEVLESAFLTRWFFDVEILLRWEVITGNRLILWEEPLLRWHEIAGSKIRLKHVISIAIELVKIINYRIVFSRKNK